MAEVSNSNKNIELVSADHVIEEGDTSVDEKKNDVELEEKPKEIHNPSDAPLALTEKVKIDILLKATADAPIMKRKKWAVDPCKKIGWIIEFIRRYLKLDPSESLFLYVNQAFAPSPDQEVRNLYECFGADGKLVLHYAKTQAWG
ncbi:autophagy protein 12-like [Limulus polyphemus]|uniref:Ubiquitin-like protein ATG12 n=1 Tax=Limulus polyphemus TaxID=6850 RepID=A0ABM1BUW0_LIMPO|nr:autophagy protein 12-like [Limulus polyphemus]